MAYYFGFLPSATLTALLDEAYQLIAANSAVRYDSYRDKITHLVHEELMQAMLGNLIANMPDGSERKAHLQKARHTIEAATNKLIDTVLTPASNDEVLPSFDFLDKQVLMHDQQGQRRISVPLNDALARQLLASIERVQQGHGTAEVDNLTRLFTELTHACLQHFLVDFTKTLPLNRFKRAAIPVADGVIKKVLSVALTRLIPQMPQSSLQQFTAYYQTMIFLAN